jgi:hypothetical protein
MMPEFSPNLDSNQSLKSANFCYYQNDEGHFAVSRLIVGLGFMPKPRIGVGLTNKVINLLNLSTSPIN